MKKKNQVDELNVKNISIIRREYEIEIYKQILYEDESV